MNTPVSLGAGRVLDTAKVPPTPHQHQVKQTETPRGQEARPRERWTQTALLSSQMSVSFFGGLLCRSESWLPLSEGEYFCDRGGRENGDRPLYSPVGPFCFLRVQPDQVAHQWDHLAVG